MSVWVMWTISMCRMTFATGATSSAAALNWATIRQTATTAKQLEASHLCRTPRAENLRDGKARLIVEYSKMLRGLGRQQADYAA